ncbi:CHAD domain-containing protein [Rhizobium sp. P28RR-XV]|nr:CHAD domain-containing protein [Rhizobium sp. P28RR-XV]NLR88183.1 CHAD domain-containing protein [Rhizobium sp. P28RR-XV]
MLAKIDDEHRHEVREEGKKFRYATDFFTLLFDDKRGARQHKKLPAAMQG